MQSLRTRIALAMVGVVAVVLVVVIANNLRITEKTTRAGVLTTVDALAITFAANCTNAVLSDDLGALQDYVQLLARRDEIAMAAVLDRQGVVLAHSDQTLVGKIEQAHAARENVYEARAPVMAGGEEWGTVRIGFSLNALVAALTEIKQQSLFAGIVALLALAVVAVMMARTLTTPLRSLVEAAATLSRGKLSEAVQVVSRDEIGTLAAAFEKMRVNLRDSVGRVQVLVGTTSTAAAETRQIVGVMRDDASIEEKSVTSTLASVGDMNEAIRSTSLAAQELSTLARDGATSVSTLDAALHDFSENANDLAASVESTSSAIQQIATAVGQVSGSVGRLSEQAEQSSQALAEIATSIQQVEESAQRSAELATRVRSDAKDRGLHAVQHTAAGLKEIAQAVDKAAQLLKRLGERSRDIGNILTVINEVTDRTNLLALNAAIIAAQAGEHGRGFGVVASEIKSLAERTANSTQEIAAMIVVIRDEVAASIEAIDLGWERAKEGVRLGLEAETSLTKVVQDADEASRMAQAIERATREQRAAVQHVSQAVTRTAMVVKDIVGATTQQEKGTREVSEAAFRISEVAQRLRQHADEQAEQSRRLRQHIGTVAERAKDITKATGAEQQKSDLIRQSMKEVQEVAMRNVRRFDDLSKMVADLASQSAKLEEESRKFAL